MVKMKLLFSLLLLLCFPDHDFNDGSGGVSVMEGDSVTLLTGVDLKQEDIKWYFNDICIAQISGDQSKNCADAQCEDGGNERFRDRLKLNCHTGSLTITNTRTTDSGVYKLWISSGSNREKIFIVTVHGVSGVDTDRVSVMEGDSVTLHTDVKTNQQDRIRWYFNDIRIAQINRDQSKICTDVQCNEGTERFRDRLKLDHQTGSLTITNTTNTDSGVYQLQISSGSSDSEKTFIIALYDVSAAERDEMKRKSVMEGESVTLHTGVIRNLGDSMMWYINEILIAEITGDQSQICTDDQCKERFRDRLKLDHQTGSLTITNTRNTDSGDYQLQINSSRFSIIRSFRVTVTAMETIALDLQSWKIKVIVSFLLGAVAALVATAGVIYYHRQTSGQERQKLKPVTVLKGEPAILRTDVKVQRDDVILWKFEKEFLIAKIKGEMNNSSTDDDGPDGRFRGRLEVNLHTGSLTITNTRTTDSGLYQLEIKGSGEQMPVESFNVTVFDEMQKVSVRKGDPVTLNTDTEIQRDDQILWMFGDEDTPIAEINGATGKISTSDGPDGTFRDRLRLDPQTGSLIMTNSRAADSGDYKLKIVRSENVSFMLFNVAVSGSSYM